MEVLKAINKLSEIGSGDLFSLESKDLILILKEVAIGSEFHHRDPTRDLLAFANGLLAVLGGSNLDNVGVADVGHCLLGEVRFIELIWRRVRKEFHGVLFGSILILG